MNLAKFNVQELSTNEMRETTGGSFLLGLLIGAVVALVAVLVSNNGGQDPDCPPQGYNS